MSRTHDVWERNVTTRREISTKHICSVGLGYKRGSDTTKGDIMEV
jgi:hypothetical protein